MFEVYLHPGQFLPSMVTHLRFRLLDDALQTSDSFAINGTSFPRSSFAEHVQYSPFTLVMFSKVS